MTQNRRKRRGFTRAVLIREDARGATRRRPARRDTLAFRPRQRSGKRQGGEGRASASCHPSKMAAPRVAHRRHRSNAWETGGRRLPRHPPRELGRVPRHDRSTQTPSRHRKGRHLARIRRLVSPFSESSSGRLKQTRPQFQDSPGRLPINATGGKKNKRKDNSGKAVAPNDCTRLLRHSSERH